jgi:hypothetical protein
MAAAAIAFRIIYNTLYFLLYIVLLLLLLVIPADVIRQASIHSQTYNVIVVGLCYLVTVLVVAFIYAMRLYINRSVLASIPKQSMPFDKGDVHQNVRKMIVAGLSRSAAITYDSRPRVLPVVSRQGVTGEGETVEEKRPQDDKRLRGLFRMKKKVTVEDVIGPHLPPRRAVWGEIDHPGWASPTSPDLPNLQYAAVISELPNLIEAKALTLAPPQAGSEANAAVLDPEAVALLQRQENMGLRDYLAHLSELGVMEASPAVSDFVTKYEVARFSTRPISNTRFRELMSLFADLLRGMQQPGPAGIIGSDSDDESGSDIDDDAPQGSHPATPTRRARRLSSRPLSRSSSSSSTDGSQIRRSGLLSTRRQSAGRYQYRTAPTTPRSRHTAISRTSSRNTFAQTRNPYTGAADNSSSMSSSSASLPSGDGGSVVIRLAERSDPAHLPYVLRIPDGI